MQTTKELKPIRVLLLEDNPGDARYVMELLDEIGSLSFNVETTDKVSSAIDSAVNNKFDIILSDLNVIDSAGINTYLKLRERIPDIPIIILTGTYDEEMGTAAVKSGVQDYLMKDGISSDLLSRSLLYSLERWGYVNRINASEEKHRVLLNSIAQPVVALNNELEILYGNKAYERSTGTKISEVIGKRIDEFCPDFTKSESYAAYKKTLETGNQQVITEQSEGRFWRTTVYPTPTGILTIAEDITEQKKVETALQRSAERYRNLIETINEGFTVFDEEENLVFTNPAFCSITGYTGEELISMNIRDLVPEDEIPFIVKKTRQKMSGEADTTQYESLIRRKNGEIRDVFVSSTLMINDAGKYSGVGIVQDITERKRAEKALAESETKHRELSIADPLTGVFNRRYFFEIGEKIVARAARSNGDVSLTMLDLDIFKDINDTYGHQAGDYVLVELARLLAESIRPNDILARYGGDEFVILFQDCDISEGLKTTERIKEAINNRLFIFNGVKLKTTISAGIAEIRELERNTNCLDDLIKLADDRLFIAKKRGRNIIIDSNNG